MLGESIFENESKMSDDQRELLKQHWHPAITKEEIFFTSKENIEGFVCFLQRYLPSMLALEVDHPCLFNIDNH